MQRQQNDDLVERNPIYNPPFHWIDSNGEGHYLSKDGTINYKRILYKYADSGQFVNPKTPIYVYPQGDYFFGYYTPEQNCPPGVTGHNHWPREILIWQTYNIRQREIFKRKNPGWGKITLRDLKDIKDVSFEFAGIVYNSKKLAKTIEEKFTSYVYAFPAGSANPKRVDPKTPIYRYQSKIEIEKNQNFDIRYKYYDITLNGHIHSLTNEYSYSYRPVIRKKRKRLKNEKKAEQTQLIIQKKREEGEENRLRERAFISSNLLADTRAETMPITSITPIEIAPPKRKISFILTLTEEEKEEERLAAENEQNLKLQEQKKSLADLQILKEEAIQRRKIISSEQPRTKFFNGPGSTKKEFEKKLKKLDPSFRKPEASEPKNNKRVKRSASIPNITFLSNEVKVLGKEGMNLPIENSQNKRKPNTNSQSEIRKLMKNPKKF